MEEKPCVKWYKTIDSTNSEARRQLDVTAPMSVFASEFQTAGRGQRGNRWTSAAGENLTFSILLHPGSGEIPPIHVADQFLLSVISSLTIYRFISEKGVGCRIKWPNDIYIRNRKVCGMLIENILSGDLISSSIIGIGLNLNQKEFPPELINPTSLFMEGAGTLDPKKSLEEISETFTGLLPMPGDQCMDTLYDEYMRLLFGKDVVRRYRDNLNGRVFDGIIRGVDRDGRLNMEMPESGIRTFAFKEVSYII